MATSLSLAGAPSAGNDAASGHIDVVDDSGRHVRLAQPAHRIISLAPHTTELVAEAGAVDSLVAVSAFSNYPPVVQHLPVVGTAFGLDLEAIAALHPDLVVAWTSGNSAPQLEAIEALGIPVYRSDPHTLEEIASSIERIGTLSGHEEDANHQAHEFRDSVVRLRQTYGQRRQVRVFYQVWADPLMTVGGHQIISSLIELCGGRNIFASLNAPAPAVEREAAIAADPEVIVAAADPDDPEPLVSWRHWPRVSAVAHQHLVEIAPDTLTRATARVVVGANTLCRAIDAAR